MVQVDDGLFLVVFLSRGQKGIVKEGLAPPYLRRETQIRLAEPEGHQVGVTSNVSINSIGEQATNTCMQMINMEPACIGQKLLTA